MTYHATTTHDYTTLDRAAWDGLLSGRQPFSDSRWLAHTGGLFKSYDAVYVSLHKNGKLVGGATANFSSQITVPIESPLMRRVVQLLLARAPLLICQSPLGNRMGLVLPLGDEAAAFGHIHAALMQAARKRHVSFVIAGWLSESLRATAEPTGAYSFMPMDNETWLPITWPSFDAYVASLSKSMQKDVRRHNNRAKALGISVERTHSVAAHRERLETLVQNVLTHHRTEAISTYRLDALSYIERAMPGTGTFLLARAGDPATGQIVGCGWLAHDQGEMWMSMLGLDYAYEYVYFQLFYEAIRYAIDHQLKAIRGGTGALSFKKRLGFQDVPTFAGYAAPNPVFRAVGAWMARAFGGNMRTEPAQIDHETALISP